MRRLATGALWAQGTAYIKIGDVEAEGRTVEEVEALLKRAAKFQKSVRAKVDDKA